MKKIVGTVLALSFVAACAAPPTNNVVVTTNSNSATETAPPAITEADAIAKEKGVWEAIRAKDYEAFAAMLASDQLEVIDDGVHDKAATIEGVKQFEPFEVNFSDWKFLSIDKDIFLVAYTVAVKGKFQGKEFPTSSVRGSSAWAYRDKKWMAVFHQECEAKPAPAGAPNRSATPTASPSATTTPAATPAPPGPDATANEQTVWDLLKAKNYDGFAAMLASDQLEVEPDGFYDKAGTTKAVSLFDASKVVLSDWKTAKLAANATLVTYTVTVPGLTPQGERHSTIWVKRDGKWSAVFHHGGTAVRKPTVPPSPPPASPAAKATASPA